MKIRHKKHLANTQTHRSGSLLSERTPPALRLQSNIAFAIALSAELTKMLAMKLSQISSGQKFNDLARRIQYQFVQNSIQNIEGTSFKQAHQHIVDGWYSAKNYRKCIKTDVDPAAFTERMTELHLPTTTIDCPARQNLAWLAQTLHLSAVEQKVLLWSYCLASRVECVQPMALREITCKPLAKAMASLAVILNEPATDVVRCYDGPSKLYGLHLLGQTHTWHFFTLNDLLNMASFTVRLLETQFDNSNDLLVALMQPQYHAVIMPDTSVSRTLLEFWLPRRVADAYQVATQHVPLSAAHIAALVHWFTRCELDAKAFSRWAGKLDFETLVLATKRYCFEQSLASQPLTASGLLHTLHVAVAQR